MKTLRCEDIGMECAFEAQGETECEVLDFEASHARRMHGVEVSGDVCSSWRESIRDVPASDTWTLG